MKEDKSYNDNIGNVLLENCSVTKENEKTLAQAREFIENYERGTIDNYTDRYANTDVGKICIMNNVKEIDIFSAEKNIQCKIDELSKQEKINDIGKLLDHICEIFLPHTIRNERNSNFLRFENKSAKAYYKMFLSWKIDGMPYNQTVGYTVRYWRQLISSGEDTLVYVGKWGDLTRGGYNPLWTDVRYKDQTQLINLAIVRIKEEQDFIDNTIIKFVEVLNDLNLIEQNLYLKIKYGTANSFEIVMIRNGFSLTLTRLLLEKYKKYVIFNIENDTIELKDDLIDAMIDSNENQILIYEAETNIIK